MKNFSEYIKRAFSCWCVDYYDDNDDVQTSTFNTREDASEWIGFNESLSSNDDNGVEIINGPYKLNDFSLNPGKWLGNKYYEMNKNPKSNNPVKQLVNDLDDINTKINSYRIEGATNTALAGLGIYGLYKLIKKLKSKSNRSSEENDKLKEAENLYNKLSSKKNFSKSDYETRTYKISGHRIDLDKLENALGFISWSCGVGHSDSVNISFDGDGNASIKIEKDGKSLEDCIDGARDQYNKISGFSDGLKVSIGD